jgi:hypothetical protein
VWKLDRLARSMKQLIETVETLRVRGIGFRSLTEALDTRRPHRGGWFFTCLAPDLAVGCCRGEWPFRFRGVRSGSPRQG